MVRLVQVIERGSDHDEKYKQPEEPDELDVSSAEFVDGDKGHNAAYDGA